jgi:predicted adenine nucleotide alpha hydrolase (AANH) superfamily ATPase
MNANKMVGMKMRKLLLHVCCGPCSTEVIDRLAREYELTLLFFNPNISPRDEFDRRALEAEKYAAARGIPFSRGEYDHNAWLEAVKGLESEPEGGKRCAVCFGHRLASAASKAKEGGIGLFTTTLTISPHKNARVVNETGLRAAKEAGVEFVEADFKKKDGFKKSLHLSKEAGMYRQDYCGCEFSRRDSQKRKEAGHEC